MKTAKFEEVSCTFASDHSVLKKLGVQDALQYLKDDLPAAEFNGLHKFPGTVMNAELWQQIAANAVSSVEKNLWTDLASNLPNAMPAADEDVRQMAAKIQVQCK